MFADKRSVSKGTRFGPFQGKLVNTSEIKTYDDNTLMWEVKLHHLAGIASSHSKLETHALKFFCFFFFVFSAVRCLKTAS